MSSVMYTGGSDEGPICAFTSDRIRESWENKRRGKIKIKKNPARAHMTSCSSPPLFHGAHRRERLISSEQPGEQQCSPGRHFGGIFWNGKSQRSSSEGNGWKDKEECWWNRIWLVKFTLLEWANEVLPSITAGFRSWRWCSGVRGLKEGCKLHM